MFWIWSPTKDMIVKPHEAKASRSAKCIWYYAAMPHHKHVCSHANCCCTSAEDLLMQFCMHDLHVSNAEFLISLHAPLIMPHCACCKHLSPNWYSIVHISGSLIPHLIFNPWHVSKRHDSLDVGDTWPNAAYNITDPPTPTVAIAIYARVRSFIFFSFYYNTVSRRIKLRRRAISQLAGHSGSVPIGASPVRVF